MAQKSSSRDYQRGPLSKVVQCSSRRRSNASFKEWKLYSAKAKSTIFLCQGDAALAKVHILVDDIHSSAAAILNKLTRIYTSFSSRAVANLYSKLESLRYRDGGDWDQHLSEFLSIIDELGAQDQVVSEKEKITKILRTLPKGLDALAMASSFKNNTFDKVTTAVAANIERWKNMCGMPPNSGSIVARAAQARTPGFDKNTGLVSFKKQRFNKSFKGKTNFGVKRTNRNGQTCHYCGKSGHFIKFCRHRIPEKSKNGHVNRKRKHNNKPYWGSSTGEEVNMDYRASVSMANFSQQPRNAQNCDDCNMGYTVARLAEYPFLSSIAEASPTKTNDIYIDSGASHNFFHNKSSFTTFERIKTQPLKTAIGTSRIVGKGFVLLNMGGNITIEAYHAPELNSTIITNHVLSEMFEVLHSSSKRSQKVCLIYKLVSLNNEDLFLEVDCKIGLYPIHNTNSKTSSDLSVMLVDKEEYGHWHDRLGHKRSERYQALSRIRNNVEKFPRSVTESYECVPCLTGKMKKAPVRSVAKALCSGIRIHVDLSGQVTPSSLGKNTFAAQMIENKSSTSELFTLSSNSQLSEMVRHYIMMVNNRYQADGFSVNALRTDNAEENLSTGLVNYCRSFGIKIKTSPAYAPKSNGTTECLVQEHWTRARVMLLAAEIPANIWAEALHRANLLQKRFPCSSIDRKIPLFLWEENAKNDFGLLHAFGTNGHAFIYYPQSMNKKLLSRSEFRHFVGMESDEGLARIFIPSINSVRKVRLLDLHIVDDSPLPSITSLMDRISRQRVIGEQGLTDSETIDDYLQTSISEVEFRNKWTSKTEMKNSSLILAPHKSYTGISDGPSLPKSFNDACNDPDWAEAIDCEYNDRIRRNTWTYIRKSSSLKPVPFKWVFHAKEMDDAGKKCLFKARCNRREDLQKEERDLGPETLYAPVAAHESTRMLLSVVASKNPILKGCNTPNAYLYGNLNVPIIMHHLTNSSGNLHKPGHYCLLQKSLHGARQAGKYGVIRYTISLRAGNLNNQELNQGYTSSTEIKVFSFSLSQLMTLLLLLMILR